MLQATKAASEVWKSMSLDEKAKYTSYAREVWDNYLSAAPTRTSKPRKQVIYFFCKRFLLVNWII